MGAPLSKYGQYMVIWIHEPARSRQGAQPATAHHGHGATAFSAVERLWKRRPCRKQNTKYADFEPLRAILSDFERFGAKSERMWPCFEHFYVANFV